MRYIILCFLMLSACSKEQIQEAKNEVQKKRCIEEGGEYVYYPDGKYAYCLLTTHPKDR